MAIVDLKKFSGLALTYDGDDLIPHEQGVEYRTKDSVHIDEMRPQLLNQDLSCPHLFYTIFSGLDWKSILKRRNLRFDMLVMNPNLAGIEYVKTKGFYAGNFPVLIDVAHGYLTLILQQTIEDEGEESKTKTAIVKLKKGDKYVIPPRWEFVFSNTRQALSICSLILSSKARVQEKYDDTRGCAHYIIRKNARQEIVHNPAYRNIKRLKMKSPEELYDDINLTARTPIFKQILRKYERFRWLHEPEQLEWEQLLEEEK